MFTQSQKYFVIPVIAVTLLVWTRHPTPAWGKKDSVTVWADEAHTRKVTVPWLDCDKIAEETKEQLSTVGLSHANIGISLTWERQKGIEFDEEAKKLIGQVKELCGKFNSGSMTLEAYNSKMREINAAEEQAREFHERLILVTKLRADAAMAELDKFAGLPADEIRESRQAAEAELARFQKGTEAVPYTGMLPRLPPTVEPEPESKKFFLLEIIDQHKNGIVSVLSGFKKRLAKIKARIKGRTDMMRIPRYREGNEEILVARLQCRGLLDEVDESLRFRPRFYMWGLGKGANVVLKESNQYDEAAQLLIIKYRQLCNEYNSGRLSQEAYLDRLQELYQAEEKAREARHEMFALVRRLAEQSHAELNQEIAASGSPMNTEMEGAMAAMEDDMLEMGENIASKKTNGKLEKPAPSLVREMTLASRRKSVEDKVTEFGESVQRVRVAPPIEMIEVWQDDARTRKVQVARLDPDALAQNVKRKLTLFVSYYNFGPEMTWAKKTGLQYDHTTQMLIIKYKQLCVDFNAGLLSLETHDRRRREIDEATERAVRFREEMLRMHQRLARAAFKELDRHIEIFSEHPPP